MDTFLQSIARDGAIGDDGIDDVDAGSEIRFDARVHANIQECIHQSTDGVVASDPKIELDDVPEESED